MLSLGVGVSYSFVAGIMDLVYLVDVHPMI